MDTTPALASNKIEETVVAPVLAPLILDNPVLLSTHCVFTVSDEQNRMVDFIRALFWVGHSAIVELEEVRVDSDSNRTILN